MEGTERRSAADRLLKSVGLALPAALLATLVLPATAFANPSDGGSCDGAGQWIICKADDDTASPGHHAEPSGNGKGSSKPPVCTYKKMEPQPPAGSEYRLGHGADEKGAIYIRHCTLTSKQGGTMPDEQLVWVADGQKPPAVDPKAVAQMAVGKMKLVGPDIASPRAAGKYTVGIPLWMWVHQSPTTYGPNEASATAGGVTVTATAKVTKIVWNMGDGSTVTCNGPGTPYTASKGMAESPTCGHTYSKTSADAGGKFKLTATSTWSIDWEVAGGGAGGQLTEVRQSQVQVVVGELQAVGS
ncbi:ATP/GTP-binding protein [Streptomyces sp. NPDC001450]